MVQKMERGIDVGTVVGAHGKGGQVVKVTFFGRIQNLLLRLGIAGIDVTGKHFLRDIVNFHGKHHSFLRNFMIMGLQNHVNCRILCFGNPMAK
jgi:hypothetical protein